MSDELVPARIEKTWEEGTRLHALILAAPKDLLAKHTAPGQYVRAKVESTKEAFLALANAPGMPFELLVQVPQPSDPARAADRIATLGAGDSVMISAPTGKGFPIDAEKGRDILLFAGGSGISAIRSVVEHIARRRDDWGRVVLFFGARRQADLAYSAAFDAWRSSSIEVVPSLSQPAEGWEGRTGYVQTALLDAKPDPKKSVAFLAGGREFSAAVVEVLGKIGVERIHKNF